jgi:hypothetical protein
MAERMTDLAAVADAAADRAVPPPVGDIRRRARRRSRRQAGLGIAGVLVLATAGVFALQQRHPEAPPVVGASSSPSSSSSSSSPVSSPSPAVELPPPAVTSSPPPAITHCRAEQLSVSLGDVGGGGAGMHTGVVLVFRNTGTVGCRMTGYPGVALLNAQNVQVVQARRTTSGFMGSAPVTTVTLAPGGSASALLEAVDIDDTSNACTQYPRMLVTAPDDTTSIRMDAGLPGCSVQIHPVVSGTSGRSS